MQSAEGSLSVLSLQGPRGTRGQPGPRGIPGLPGPQVSESPRHLLLFTRTTGPDSDQLREPEMLWCGTISLKVINAQIHKLIIILKTPPTDCGEVFAKFVVLYIYIYLYMSDVFTADSQILETLTFHCSTSRTHLFSGSSLRNVSSELLLGPGDGSNIFCRL